MVSDTKKRVHRACDGHLLDGQGAPLRELLINELPHHVYGRLELVGMHSHGPSLSCPTGTPQCEIEPLTVTQAVWCRRFKTPRARDVSR